MGAAIILILSGMIAIRPARDAQEATAGAAVLLFGLILGVSALVPGFQF